MTSMDTFVQGLLRQPIRNKKINLLKLLEQGKANIKSAYLKIELNLAHCTVR